MDVKRGKALDEIRGPLLLSRMEFTHLPLSISQHVSSKLKLGITIGWPSNNFDIDDLSDKKVELPQLPILHSIDNPFFFQFIFK